MAYVKYVKRLIYKVAVLSGKSQTQMEISNTIEMGETVIQ